MQIPVILPPGASDLHESNWIPVISVIFTIMTRRSNISSLVRRLPLFALLDTAQSRLDAGLDGNVELCDAWELWMKSGTRFRPVQDDLIGRLFGMALHGNACIGTADCVRDNLRDNPEDCEMNALGYADLCKLQAFNASRFLFDISDAAPEAFSNPHVGKLLGYATMAEQNRLCAVGRGSVYDCLLNIAARQPEAFSRHNIMTMASKSELDLRPVTESDRLNPYKTILNAVGIHVSEPFKFKRPAYPSCMPGSSYKRRVPANEL